MLNGYNVGKDTILTMSFPRRIVIWYYPLRFAFITRKNLQETRRFEKLFLQCPSWHRDLERIIFKLYKEILPCSGIEAFYPRFSVNRSFCQICQNCITAEKNAFKKLPLTGLEPSTLGLSCSLLLSCLANMLGPIAWKTKTYIVMPYWF